MLRVALPWYQLSFLRAEYDELWVKLRVRLEREGETDLPSRLERDRPNEELLTSPELLFTQTCGYDIAVDRDQRLQLVATPALQISNCADGYYRSVVVTRIGHNMKSARFVANDLRSWSGLHVLRGMYSLDLRQTLFSGAHERSLEMIQQNEADFAAIDALTYALIQRERPARLRGLEIIASTMEMPAPPIVTRFDLAASRIEGIRRAFKHLVTEEPILCAHLGFRDFIVLPRARYADMALGFGLIVACGLGKNL